MFLLSVSAAVQKVCLYLVSEKSGDQGAVDVTEDEPDQNHDQVLHKRCGERVSDECELVQQQRETKRRKQKLSLSRVQILMFSLCFYLLISADLL